MRSKQWRRHLVRKAPPCLLVKPMTHEAVMSKFSRPARMLASLAGWGLLWCFPRTVRRCFKAVARAVSTGAGGFTARPAHPAAAHSPMANAASVEDRDEADLFPKREGGNGQRVGKPHQRNPEISGHPLDGCRLTLSRLLLAIVEAAHRSWGAFLGHTVIVRVHRHRICPARNCTDVHGCHHLP